MNKIMFHIIHKEEKEDAEKNLKENQDKLEEKEQDDIEDNILTSSPDFNYRLSDSAFF